MPTGMKIFLYLCYQNEKSCIEITRTIWRSQSKAILSYFPHLGGKPEKQLSLISSKECVQNCVHLKLQHFEKIFICFIQW